MKKSLSKTALFLSLLVSAPAFAGVCESFRAEYGAESGSTQLKEIRFIGMTDKSRLPLLNEIEKYMVQTAVLATSGTDAMNVNSALSYFFTSRGGDGDGTITYYKLRYGSAGQEKSVEVAQAKYYGGENPIGAVFAISRDELNVPVYAELIGVNSDDSIACLNYR